MSKIKLTGNASGTGTLTIAAPNTNVDRTLTLPDGAGEILTNASSLPAANLTGTLPAIDGSNLTGVGGGKILQVVTGELSTQGVYTSSAYTDIGLSASITPSSTSSKIFVIVTVNLTVNNNSDASGNAGWSIRDGSNNVLVYSQGDTTPFDLGYYGSLWYNINGVQTRQFVHSPNTTSAFTYKVSAQCGYASNLTVNYTTSQNYAPRSYITLMEIAG